MNAPWPSVLRGRLDKHLLTSEALRSNPLGDPAERPMWVYVPPGYDERDGRRYPTVYLLQGFFGHLDMWANRAPFTPPFIEEVDRAFASGSIPPAILVFIDSWTSYGGSQFLDSPGTGRYHSYFCDEIVPWVDGHYRTVDAQGGRAVSGKSSGGYGALVSAMLRPDLFGGVACHAGDALFEYTCFAKFPKCVRFLRAYGGDIERWWRDFSERGRVGRPEDPSLLIVYGMSACLSPTPDGVPQLPFDPVSGAVRAEVWQRWLALDPVRMIPAHADAWRGMRAVWIDCGAQDEHFLDVGAQGLRAALSAVGVTDDALFHFELFPGAHGGLDHRYLLSLDWLSRRLERNDPAVRSAAGEIALAGTREVTR
ncbi:alpha/beta hydrolase-fold protein [Blastococcus montanus]|uniref:alpha/beta hydrolase n=1 Tax=Blastococcus montanus TaxID=3144973 RepID=UPI00320A3BFC